MKTDRNTVDAKCLDRLVEIDLALFDMKTLSLELLRDIGGRHRAEELAFLADARREGQLHLLELFGETLRGATALIFRGLEAITLLLNALEVARSRREGDAVRQQVV